MKKTPITKWMLFVAIGITVIISALVLQQNRKIRKITETFSVNSTITSPLSPGVSTNDTRKRPNGTKNWVQYINKENNIAFLYPNDFFIKEQEIENNKLVVGLYLSDLKDKNSVLLITISEGTLDEKINKYLNIKWNPSWNGHVQKLTDKNVNGYTFVGYNISSTYEPTKETQIASHYFTQRNNEVVELNFRDIEVSSLKTIEFFPLILLDGTHFDN